MERLLNKAMAITFSPEERNEMENTVENFLSQMNIQRKVPVDIFELALQLGFDVRGAIFNESLDGAIMVDENRKKIGPFNSNKVIVYNKLYDIYHKRFIVAHELAHFIRAKTDNPNTAYIGATRDHKCGYSDDREEQEMDYMAATLLIPREDLRIFLNKPGSAETFEVSERYKVSLLTACRRMNEVSS